MTKPRLPAGYGTSRLSLQPPRAYELPGGPYARSLGSIDVYVLAEIERGGDDDQGCGSRR